MHPYLISVTDIIDIYCIVISTLHRDILVEYTQL